MWNQHRVTCDKILMCFLSKLDEMKKGTVTGTGDMNESLNVGVENCALPLLTANFGRGDKGSMLAVCTNMRCCLIARKRHWEKSETKEAHM